MHPNDTPVPDGAYRINLQAWTETDGHSLKVTTSVEHRKDDESPERVVMEKLLDLEDAAIRDGLQRLGWIAPHPAVEELAKAIQQPATIDPSPSMRDALIGQGWVPPESTDPMQVLRNVRQALQRINDDPQGAIVDTLWLDNSTTLFDYIDMALAG